MRHAHPRGAGSGLRLNERLVRERDRARARELRRFVLCGAALALPLLAYLWQRVAFLELSYHVEALAKERQELLDRKKALTAECSFLLSPQRIESVARRQIGLVDPLPEDVRRVRLIDGRVDEVGGPVASAAAPGSERPATIEAAATGAATAEPPTAAIRPAAILPGAPGGRR